MIAMPAEDAARWYRHGAAGPVADGARRRGADYIYNFLKGFYVDPDSPTGVDNTGAAGHQHAACALGACRAIQRSHFFRRTEDDGHDDVAEFEGFEQVIAGSMDAEDYDELRARHGQFPCLHLEPIRSGASRQVFGTWVMIYLLVFFLIIALCSRSRSGRTSKDDLMAIKFYCQRWRRRSVMTLFSRPTTSTAIVRGWCLLRRTSTSRSSNVAGPDLPEDLMDLNPYHTVPTLVDRDLTLYDSRVIIEYLDERFPHPPLMPVDPVMRAQFRLALFRIETDWYSIAEEASRTATASCSSKSRKMLRESILQSTELICSKAVFPERGILARRLQHRADPVASAGLRYRARQHRPSRLRTT